MAWSFEGSWTILISGTAVGLSLIAWSLHRCRQQLRQQPLEIVPEGRTTPPEQHGSEQPEATANPPSEEPAPATQPLATLPEPEDPPPPRHTNDADAALFAIRPEMYEPKPAAEELPPAPIPRRPVRKQAAEQLLLWPDADEPPTPAVHQPVPTTTERR